MYATLVASQRQDTVHIFDGKLWPMISGHSIIFMRTGGILVAGK